MPRTIVDFHRVLPHVRNGALISLKAIAYTLLFIAIWIVAISALIAFAFCVIGSLMWFVVAIDTLSAHAFRMFGCFALATGIFAIITFALVNAAES